MSRLYLTPLNQRLSPSLDSVTSPETTVVEKVAMAAALLGIPGEICWGHERFMRADGAGEEPAAWMPQFYMSHCSGLWHALSPEVSVVPNGVNYTGTITAKSEGQEASVVYDCDFREALASLLVHLAAMVYLAGDATERPKQGLALSEEGASRACPKILPGSPEAGQLVKRAAVVASMDGELSRDGKEFLRWPDFYYSWDPLEDIDNLLELMPCFEHSFTIATGEDGVVVTAQAFTRKGKAIRFHAHATQDIEAALMLCIVKLASAEPAFVKGEPLKEAA